MTYSDFLADFPHCRDVRFYFPPKPGTVTDPARVQSADLSAAHDLARLEELAEGLRIYRRELAARYAYLATAHYSERLEFVRSRVYRAGHVTYTLTLSHIYEDGTVQFELHEAFPGSERRAAFARFAELRKRYPSATVEQDTAKKPWEQ